MRGFWRAFKRNKLAVVGGIVVGCLALLAVLAPAISPWDPNRPDVRKILDPPSSRHPFGTDQLGRDVFSRVISATRLDFIIAVSSSSSCS